MANKKIPMKKLRSVIRLHCNSYSKQSISKTLGLSRNTVRKYIKTFKALELSLEDVESMNGKELSEYFSELPIFNPNERLEKLKSFFPYMSKELKKVGVTRMILWEEYRNLHPDGYGKTQFN